MLYYIDFLTPRFSLVVVQSKNLADHAQVSRGQDNYLPTISVVGLWTTKNDGTRNCVPGRKLHEDTLRALEDATFLKIVCRFEIVPQPQYHFFSNLYNHLNEDQIFHGQYVRP